MESRYPNVMCVVCEIVNSFVLELDNYVQVANQDVIIAFVKIFFIVMVTCILLSCFAKFFI